MPKTWRRQDYVFDRYVTVQYRVEGDSETHFPVDDWDETRSRNIPMARLPEYFRGGETQAALQVHAAVETRWMMRYRADMDPDLVDVGRNRRLVYKGRVLDILSAEPVGRKEYVELRTTVNPSGETA